MHRSRFFATFHFLAPKKLFGGPKDVAGKILFEIKLCFLLLSTNYVHKILLKTRPISLWKFLKLC